MTDWPNDARAAVAFTFDFDAEEVWIGEDPANADRPGILSQGTYGAKVAVPLVLELLRRRELRGSGQTARPRSGRRDPHGSPAHRRTGSSGRATRTRAGTRSARRSRPA